MTTSKEYMIEWRKKNSERLKQYSKDYSAKHKERIKKYMKSYVRPPESQKKQKEQRKGYVENNWKKVQIGKRDSTLKKKYGITLNEFKSMIEKQNNTCPICLRLFQDKVDPCTDHCHITKKVRGILCRQCNAAIGQLGDSKEALARALEYLSQ